MFVVDIIIYQKKKTIVLSAHILRVRIGMKKKKMI